MEKRWRLRFWRGFEKIYTSSSTDHMTFLSEVIARTIYIVQYIYIYIYKKDIKTYSSGLYIGYRAYIQTLLDSLNI